MKRCAYCLKPIGLQAYKRWGDLYFCSGAHLTNYCKERQQESQIADFLWWLIESRAREKSAKVVLGSNEATYGLREGGAGFH
jgi:hypothetical protein